MTGMFAAGFVGMLDDFWMIVRRNRSTAGADTGYVIGSVRYGDGWN